MSVIDGTKTYRHTVAQRTPWFWQSVQWFAAQAGGMGVSDISALAALPSRKDDVRCRATVDGWYDAYMGETAEKRRIYGALVHTYRDGMPATIAQELRVGANRVVPQIGSVPVPVGARRPAPMRAADIDWNYLEKHLSRGRLADIAREGIAWLSAYSIRLESEYILSQEKKQNDGDGIVAEMQELELLVKEKYGNSETK